MISCMLLHVFQATCEMLRISLRYCISAKTCEWVTPIITFVTFCDSLFG